jgi:Holliday junction resolvase-like predicted endonuclease
MSPNNYPKSLSKKCEIWVKITGQIGEYLVAAELGRQGYIATTFTGNVPEFDILVTDDKLRTIPIQVKTIRRGGAFQSVASKWMDISIEKKRKQIIHRKVRLANPRLVFVMVVLGEKYGEDEFYLLTQKQLQDIHVKAYSTWLKERKGIRPRKPESLHCAVSPDKLQAFHDNWGIFKGGRKQNKVIQHKGPIS